MTVHPGIFYIRIYFCSDLFSAVVLHQDLREQYVETELPQSCYIEASLHKSEPNHFPDCVRDILEFLGG